MSVSKINNKRIAKNTFFLYIRMLFLMGISLYTSRVILQTLGIQDFGIHNVVGGFVAMFAVISKSLSAAASRFLNYEMGRGNQFKLSNVFSTTLIIHVFLSIIIAVLAEIIGMYFLNNKMVIPSDRLIAANWVFHISLLTFCASLIAVPYHASIIAHERMIVFAYISIFEGVAKLLVCFLLLISPIDRLIFYSFLLLIVQFVVIIINWWYCRRYFMECRSRFVYDKNLIKEIFGFASWNMIGASASVLRNQGGNILLNLFGGPVVNAARAIANQVLHAVNGFVENFVLALNPQITQSYACGDNVGMMSLIYRGSRLCYYLMLLMCLPLLFNTDYLIHLWLKRVPDHTILFVQLTLIFNMVEVISRPIITALLATGKIRNYQMIVGGLNLLNLPISYVLLRMGGAPEVVLYVAIFLSCIMFFSRLHLLRRMINLNALDFLKRIIINILLVTIISSIIPFFILNIKTETFGFFLFHIIVCVVCSLLSIYFVGLQKEERQFILYKMKGAFRHLRCDSKSLF
jgi:O-antigen/teichoic acid export membrane protein